MTGMAIPREQMGHWRAAEDARLQGLSLAAQVVYLRGLRFLVDREGVAGSALRVTWQTLATVCSFEPDRGSTKRPWRPTRDAIRAAIDELVRVGLVVRTRLSERFKGLVLLLPLAVPSWLRTWGDSAAAGTSVRDMNPHDERPCASDDDQLDLFCGNNGLPACGSVDNSVDDRMNTPEEPPATPTGTPVKTTTPTAPRKRGVRGGGDLDSRQRAMPMVGEAAVPLILPAGMARPMAEAARRLLRGLDADDAQALADELSGQIAAGGVRNPVGYLRGLITRHAAGTFSPEAGIAVRDARTRQAASARRLAAAELQGPVAAQAVAPSRTASPTTARPRPAAAVAALKAALRGGR